MRVARAFAARTLRADAAVVLDAAMVLPVATAVAGIAVVLVVAQPVPQEQLVLVQAEVPLVAVERVQELAQQAG